MASKQSPEELAQLSEDDYKLNSLLYSDPEELSVDEFKQMIDLITSAQEVWLTEEKAAAAEKRKINPRKGRKKLTKEQKEKAVEIVAAFDPSAIKFE